MKLLKLRGDPFQLQDLESYLAHHAKRRLARLPSLDKWETLKMDAVGFSETFVSTYKSKLHHHPHQIILNGREVFRQQWTMTHAVKRTTAMMDNI